MSGLFLGIGGLAVSIGSSAMSFGQAGAARREREAAQIRAEKMMAEARKKLEVNVFDELSVNKEVYNIEREKILEQATGATQAVVEGDERGAAAGVGRVQLATQEGQGKIRAAQEQEVNKLEKLQADEDSRLRDMNVKLDLQEVEGAQMAAADAGRRAEAAKMQGIQSAGAALQQGLSMVPLFSQNIGGQRKAVADMDFSDASFDNIKVGNTQLKDIDFSNYKNRDFRRFKQGLSGTEKGQIFGSDAYETAYASYAPKQFNNAFGMEYGAGSMNSEYQQFLDWKKSQGN
jgi:hypothetical protein